MTDNKTLLKQFANIYSSCNKAKQGALAEIGKIDEKYRKLAEKEKEQLNELVKALDSQMEMYGNYLGLNKTEDKTEEPVEEPAEDLVKDELFPDNNEEIEKTGEKLSEETVKPASVPADDTVTTNAVNVEWPAEETQEKETVVLDDFGEQTLEPYEVEDEKELVPVYAEEKTVEEIDKENQEAAENVKLEEKIVMPSEWPEVTEEPAAKKKEVPVLEDGEDGWPDYPEDWK